VQLHVVPPTKHIYIQGLSILATTHIHVAIIEACRYISIIHKTNYQAKRTLVFSTEIDLFPSFGSNYLSAY